MSMMMTRAYTQLGRGTGHDYTMSDRETWRMPQPQVATIASPSQTERGWRSAAAALDAIERRSRPDDEIEWPSIKAIESGRKIIDLMSKHGGFPPSRVVADGIGGISFEWRIGEKSRYINFYEDGSFDSVVYDDSIEVKRISFS